MSYSYPSPARAFERVIHIIPVAQKKKPGFESIQRHRIERVL